MSVLAQISRLKKQEYILTPWSSPSEIVISNSSDSIMDLSSTITNEIRWRRVGDTMEVSGRMRKNGNTINGFPGAFKKISIPFQKNIDTSKMSVSGSDFTRAVGSGWFYQGAAPLTWVCYAVSSTSEVSFKERFQSNDRGWVDGLSPSVSISFEFSVPIEGWGVNTGW